MQIYSEELKLKVIKEFKESNETKADICKKYGITEQTMDKWRRLYDAYGATGLIKKTRYNTYSGTFKQTVVEDMRHNHLSQYEVSLKYQIERRQVQNWERIYLEEGPERLFIDHRGRKGKGKTSKELGKKVEEDLIAENQRLRMEIAYLKKLNALVHEKGKSN